MYLSLGSHGTAAAHLQRPRVPRPAGRWLNRLVTWIVILTCLVQPATPALANGRPIAAAARSQPAALPADSSAGEPRAAAPRELQVGRAPASQGWTPVPGITAYAQSDVSCAYPQYSPIEPAYSAEGHSAYTMISHALYICSQGATVHLRMVAEAEGWGCNAASTHLRCLDSGCTFSINPQTVVVYGYNCIFCNRLLNLYEADVYLPAGKYELYAEAGANGACATTLYRIDLRISAPAASTGRCLAKEDSCDCNCPQKHGRDPVNTRSGNFTHQEVDFTIPTRGLPLEFERSYNSLDTAVGPLGQGWTHSYNLRLITGTNTITLVAPRGSQLTFDKRGDGSYAAWPGVRDTLVRNADGTYTVTRGDRVVRTFDAGGRLTSVRDPDGNTTALTYADGNLTAVTAPDGRALTLSYDGQGRIVEVSDPLSRTIHYSYTGNTLTSLTDRMGQTWTYAYDAQGRMTALADPDGRAASNEYDSQGRVVLQRDRLGQVSRFSYSAGYTVLTDTNSVPITHTYSSAGVLTPWSTPWARRRATSTTPATI